MNISINKDTLVCILRETKCEWTRGFVACLLHSQAPTRNEIARDLIEATGLSQKIQCIKRIREAFGIGLKEAKHLVDEYQSSGQIVGLPHGDNLDDGSVGAKV